jgi:hypothetical protein
MSSIVLPLSELPTGVREGDVLKLSFAIDAAARKADAAALDEQRRRLLERSKDEPL